MASSCEALLIPVLTSADLFRGVPGCATHVSAAGGTFRVNANGRRLDVWLLIRCAHCGHNARIKVRHRTNVSSFDPGELGGYLDNDPKLSPRR